MILNLLYTLVRFVLDLLLVRGRPESYLRVEVLALRHELRVFERQRRRPRWQPADRLLLASFSRILRGSGSSSLLPSPETLLRWHRELVRRKWAAFGKRPRRQFATPSELHQLIVRLARENPRWGYRRIQGELLKLGYRCSHITVRSVLRRHDLMPAPRRGLRSWQEFVRQHTDQLLAVDFFTVETVWLSRLYVLFFIEVGSRRIHLAGCTSRPAGDWVVQQARHLAWRLQEGELSAKFLLRDRDAKFTTAFDEVFRSEAVRVIRLPFRAPRANAFAERWVGTVRRELLDHCLIFGVRHLEIVLHEVLHYYHHARPSQGIGQLTPISSVEPALAPAELNRIVRIDRLGGLIHEYRQAA